MLGRLLPGLPWPVLTGRDKLSFGPTVTLSWLPSCSEGHAGQVLKGGYSVSAADPEPTLIPVLISSLDDGAHSGYTEVGPTWAQTACSLVLPWPQLLPLLVSLNWRREKKIGSQQLPPQHFMLPVMLRKIFWWIYLHELTSAGCSRYKLA